MMTKEELYLLRTYLGLTGEDAAKLMQTTKATISNIETGKLSQKSTIFLYEKTLLEVLANREDGPTTYDEYCEAMIAKYSEMLRKFELAEQFSSLHRYLDNDIRVSYEAFNNRVNAIQKQIKEE